MIKKNTLEKYRDLVKTIEDTTYKWHTHENKQTGLTFVMQRNCQKNAKLEVLPLYVVSFSREEDVKGMYKIQCVC